MGCDDYPILGGRYKLGAILAVQWNTELAQQFPHIDHTRCRQQMWADERSGRWQPFDPAECVDYHCPHCGQPCNSLGHHNCTNPPGDTQ